MPVPLPHSFLRRPIAHRGLHDTSAGRAENGLKAIQAAIDANYGIEIDIQMSRDSVPMVFHDYYLDRLTDAKGAIGVHNADALSAIPLKEDGDRIPTLDQVLHLVQGQVPLLIEMKDQDGQMGPSIGPMGQALAHLLQGYDGDVALMSFNPHHVDEVAHLLPDRPRGLVTDAFHAADWPTLSEPTRRRLRDIPDYDAVRASFVSHNVSDLTNPRIDELKSGEAHILCWTVKSAKTEVRARKTAHNITFEGYTA